MSRCVSGIVAETGPSSSGAVIVLNFATSPLYFVGGVKLDEALSSAICTEQEKETC